MQRLRVLAVLFCALAAAAARTPGIGVADAVPGQHWLVVSDIHFDPSDTEGRPVYYEEDTNRALLDSAIAEMHRVDPNPPVVLVLGDFFAHHFTHVAEAAIRESRLKAHAKPPSSVTAEALATMRELVKRFATTFPHAQFFMVFGNNDDPCGDYHVGADTAYMRAVARMWEPLIERSGLPRIDSAQTLSEGGYYTAAVPSAGNCTKIRVVALNSVYWSFVYRNSCAKQALNPAEPLAKDPGGTELNWLAATLRATPAGTENLVIMHIPPGTDAYSTAEIHGVAAVPFLRPDYDARLRGMLSDPASHITVVLASHAHRTEFRTLGDIPLLMVPSISPVYRNAPSFFVLDVAPAAPATPNGIAPFIRDYSAYMYRYGIFDHNDRGDAFVGWEHAYDFQKQFGVSAFDADAVRTIGGKVLAGWVPPLTAGFMTDKYTRCAENENGSFGSCAGVTRKDWFLVVGLAVVVICAFVIVLGYLRVRGPSAEE